MTSIGNATSLAGIALQATDVIPVERPGVTTPYKTTVSSLALPITKMANIEDYGGIEGGTADCTTAFDAAVATGYPVFIPKGSWLFSSAAGLIPSKTKIIGYGYETNLIFDGSSGYLFQTQPSNGSTYTNINVEIRDLRITLNNDDTGGIFWDRCYYQQGSNITVYGTGQSASSNQVGMKFDGGATIGSYYGRFNQIYLQSLHTGLLLPLKANVQTFSDLVIRNTYLPIDIDGCYGFSWIGGTAESYGDPTDLVTYWPAITTASDGGTVLGVSFEGHNNSSVITYADTDVCGWYIQGHFSVNGARTTGGDESKNILIDNVDARKSIINGQKFGIHRLTGTDVSSKYLELSSDDVAHGITDFAPTTTLGYARRVSNDGGVQLDGLTEDAVGMLLQSHVTTGNTTKNSTADGAIRMVARKKTGTTSGAMGSNENLLVVRDYGSTRMILDAEGELHLDAAVPAAFDTFDDITLLNGLRASLLPTNRDLSVRFGQFADESRQVLESAGIVSYNPDGTPAMVSMKGLSMLLVDALRQFAEKTEARLSSLENK